MAFKSNEIETPGELPEVEEYKNNLDDTIKGVRGDQKEEKVEQIQDTVGVNLLKNIVLNKKAKDQSSAVKESQRNLSATTASYIQHWDKTYGDLF